MAKYFGIIGYAIPTEVKPGVWKDELITREVSGDIIRNTRRLQSGDKLNDDINVSNVFSILADPFATENIYAMRYITYMGTKWKITDVEVLYPRLNLTIGGVYNGK